MSYYVYYVVLYSDQYILSCVKCLNFWFIGPLEVKCRLNKTIVQILITILTTLLCLFLLLMLSDALLSCTCRYVHTCANHNVHAYYHALLTAFNDGNRFAVNYNESIPKHYQLHCSISNRNNTMICRSSPT